VHEQNPAGALRRLVQREVPEPCLYRGWMRSVVDYARLAAALEDRGYRPIQSPEAYRTCHELPASYPFITGHTPKAVWLPAVWLPQEGGRGSTRSWRRCAPSVSRR
jgi:hypothetical protein